MYPTTVPPVVLNERVPDPAVKILDHSFEKYRLPLASVERLSQGSPAAPARAHSVRLWRPSRLGVFPDGFLNHLRGG